MVACPNQDVVYGAGSIGTRRRAGGVPGAGFRRPLLGLPGRRSATDSFADIGKMYGTKPGLLSAGRPATGRAKCRRESPRSSVPATEHRRSSSRASSMDDTAEDAQAVQAADHEDRHVPAVEYDGTDEAARLGEADRSSRRRTPAAARKRSGSAGDVLRQVAAGARRRAAAAGRGGALRRGAGGARRRQERSEAEGGDGRRGAKGRAGADQSATCSSATTALPLPHHWTHASPMAPCSGPTISPARRSQNPTSSSTSRTRRSISTRTSTQHGARLHGSQPIYA